MDVDAVADILLRNDKINNPYVPDFIERKVLKLGLSGIVFLVGTAAGTLARRLACKATLHVIRRLARKP